VFEESADGAIIWTRIHSTFNIPVATWVDIMSHMHGYYIIYIETTICKSTTYLVKEKVNKARRATQQTTVYIKLIKN